MISRFGRMGIVLAMLVAASPCLGAEPGHVPGKGGVGGQVGVSSFRLDRAFGSDWFDAYSAGAQTRFSFSGHFRYIVNPWLRWQVSPGFTWAAYNKKYPAPYIDAAFPDDTDKSDYLTILVPISAQAQYVVQRGAWVYHLGAGPGLYRVLVEHHRKPLKDPVTLKLHRKLHLGGSAQIGAERFLKALPSTSIEVTLAGHLAFTQDDDFVSGIDSNLMALELKVGTNYYFGFGERKKQEEEGLLPHERE